MENKLRLSVKIGFDDNASDSLKEMAIATIKHDIVEVLMNHANMIDGFVFSDIRTVEIGKHKFNCLEVVME